MYLNAHHRFDDAEAIASLLAAHPLGAWVCADGEGLVANHLPFVLDRSRGPLGSLIGHVARANPVWRALDPALPSVVMFQGPQAYITPNWYPGKTAHGRVVPTWNYAVAHAHGVARAVHERDWLLEMLNRLTTAQEASQPTPWRVSDAPADYIDAMLRAIVGIEIPIDRFEGKLKASQDEAMEDRQGTVAGLRASGCPLSFAVAGEVQAALEGEALRAARLGVAQAGADRKP